MPEDPTFEINGKTYTFKSWNTKADGSGSTFTATTDVTEDITVYAIWEEYVPPVTPDPKPPIKPEPKPQPKPDPEPKPEPEPIVIPTDLTSILFKLDDKILNTDRHFKYMFGYPEGIFLPDGNMTRAEAMAMFNRILFDGVDKNYIYDGNFTDVDSSAWYAKVVGYMTKYGFINGYPDGSFKPNQPITRAEFAYIAAKVSRVENFEESKFSDLDSNYWAYNDINKLVSEGWIEGYEDGTFKPESEITRSEAITIANRMQIRYPDKDYINTNKFLLEGYTDLDESHWAYYQIMEAANGHEFERIGNTKDERWNKLIDLGEIMNTK
jgi:uncharacterized repeat protein (TIGR02543 family)